MNRSPIALLILAATLSGCASTGKFPSLLPRDVEQHSYDLEPRRAAPALTPDATLDAGIADAEKRFTASAGRFATVADTASRSIVPARGAAPGSDAWLDAQRALGELDSAHADVVALAADLDGMAIARASSGNPVYPALEALRQRVDAEIAAESARLDALHAGIASG